MRVRDAKLRAIFERYGYDPDDPAPRDDEGQRIIPDKLLRALANTRIVEEGEPLARAKRGDLPPTPLEMDTLELVACGYGAKEIADRQQVSIHTVKARLQSMYRKLGARNAAHAVALAIAQRLIPRE